MIKCSKCGSENLDEANFCEECGASLEKEKKLHEEETQNYYCPKCGTLFQGKKKFCNVCGLKFNWPNGNYDEIPIKANKKVANASVTKQTKEKASSKMSLVEKPELPKLMNIIFYAAILLITGLSILSMFLPAVTMSGIVANEFGFMFWFSTLWQNPGPDYAIYIPAFIIFIAALISTLVFGILTIIKSIKALVNKTEFKMNKSIPFAILPSLIYFSFYKACNFIQSREIGITFGTQSGAGYVIAVICSCLLICILLTKQIYQYIKFKNNKLVSIIAGGISLVAIIVASLTMTGTAYNAGNVLYSTNSMYLELESITRNYVPYMSAIPLYISQAKAYSSSGSLFGAMAIIFAGLCAIFNFMTYDQKKKKNLVFPILTTAIFVVQFTFVILCCNVLSQGENVKIGGGIIVALIFLVFSIASNIVVYATKETTSNNE